MSQTKPTLNVIVLCSKQYLPPPGGVSANGSLFGGDGVLQGGGVCGGLQGQCAGEKIPPLPNFT